MKTLQKELTEREILEDLTDRWCKAKSMEKKYQQERLLIEESILEMTPMPNQGTVNLPTGIKISIGTKKEWDQPMLADIYNKMTDKKDFPFMFEAKPLIDKMRVIERESNDLWETIQTALTVTPTKPSFSYKGE